MNTFPILYSRTSTGSVQQWQQEVSGDSYRTISGKVDGKLVTSAWKVCVGKNIGKSNETTPEQQAELEVEANYKKKRERNYHDNIENIDEALMFEPMLAKGYTDYKDEVEENLTKHRYFTQPKLDGMRCVADTAGLWSRNGKKIISCPHIEESLSLFRINNPSITLDGELYNHTLKDDFDELMSILKKQKLTQEIIDYSRANAEYHVYDLYDSQNPGLTFSERQTLLKELTANIPFLHHVETRTVSDSLSTIDSHYEHDLSNGYEGTMVRADLPYETKRTKNLLKRKETITEEYVLIDILPGTGNWAGVAKTAVLLRSNCDTFSAHIASKRERCREILENRDMYLGKPTTVTFQSYTPSGVPRFGRVKELGREDC